MPALANLALSIQEVKLEINDFNIFYDFFFSVIHGPWDLPFVRSYNID